MKSGKDKINEKNNKNDIHWKKNMRNNNLSGNECDAVKNGNNSSENYGDSLLRNNDHPNSESTRVSETVQSECLSTESIVYSIETESVPFAVVESVYSQTKETENGDTQKAQYTVSNQVTHKKPHQMHISMLATQ